MIKATYLFTAWIAATACASAAEYENPVRPGDFPDPSVIRVGQEYWATATSSEWAPYFPLLHSRDLIHWELKGPVFSERPEWAKSNFWAPEIAENNGTYFIYYTARHRESNRLAVAVATSSHPGGPYVDHGPLVMEEEGSIDAAPYTDADGVRWLLWKNDGNSVRKPTPIWLQRLSDDGLKLVGERRQILTNDTPWEGAVVEGPFVLRHGDYYYLFYSGGACCGRECTYALGVARAKSMAGPWEKAPTNPILATNDTWRCPGHGSIVTDPQGRFWLLYHSYAQQGFVATGRQMLLDEIVFGADGWPSINGGRGPSTRSAAPSAADKAVVYDDFDATALAAGWQWLNGPRPSVTIQDGRLTLSPAAEPTGLVQSVRTPSFVVETSVDTTGLGTGAVAGLVVYGDRANNLHLATDGSRIQIWSQQRSKRTDLAEVNIDNSRVVALRISCQDGNRFRFAVQHRNRSWREIGVETNGAHLPPWDRGVRVGLMVTGSASVRGSFDYFSVTPGNTHFLLP